jgi:hypothetical protein
MSKLKINKQIETGTDDSRSVEINTLNSME